MPPTDWPVISDEASEGLITMPKYAPADWPAMLVDTLRSTRGFRRSRLDISAGVDTGPIRGSFFLFLRLHEDKDAALTDFTVGLGFYNLDRTHAYRLIRCNGGSHPHRNTIEKELIPPTPHVHRISERYQRRHTERAKWQGDGHAVAASQFTDLAGAIDHLVNLAHLAPSDALFFLGPPS